MVLFVSDDDPFVRDMESMLLAYGNIRVRVARDSNEALGLLGKLNIQLVVIDGDMSHLKWTHIIGELYRFSGDIRVVVLLSGLVRPETGISDLLRVGGDAIIEKADAGRLLPRFLPKACC